MSQTANPLASYFRKPGIHITLPSKGVFTPPEELDLSITNELAVYPMTGKDEMWSKNPDGLLNGYSIENIIKSCVPGVKNPRTLPSIDIDYLMLAIKRASFGDTMKITTNCPKCGNEHDFECSIDGVMSTLVPLEPAYTARISDELVVNLRPYNFEATTRTNILAFEETKLFQSFVNSELSEEGRVRLFSSSFEKITSLQLDMLADCVISVVTPEGEVSDRTFIKEFILNSDKDTTTKLQDELKKVQEAGVNRNVQLDCPVEDCLHSWTTELMFDPAHFFE